MQNTELKIEDGTIKYGEKKIELNGSIEEKIQQLDNMPFEDFKLAINLIIKETPNCFEHPLLNSAIDYFAKGTQIEYCYILYRMSEEEIKKAVDRGVKGEAFFDLYSECINTERKMYELLYKPEVFTEKGLKWMSDELKYNDIMFRFISGGALDYKLPIEAAKIRPDMANVIKVWIGALR